MTSKIVVNNIGSDTGINTVTFDSNVERGTSNLHSVGVEVAGINVLGADTPIGTGSTIYDDGGARFSGIVTATSFSGDGANLTGVSGFSTALGNTQGTLENLIFKTTESFTVGAGQSIRLESDNMSGNTVFTRLSRINVSTGATFHVSAGTTFVMNVLNVF